LTICASIGHNKDMSNILIVDDDNFIRAALNFAFQKEGHAVYEAENGFICLDIINKEKIDLIILDLKMEGMDGYTALREIRKLPEYKETPVLVYSAFIEKENLTFLENHANEILVKPVNTEDLISFIELYLP